MSISVSDIEEWARQAEKQKVRVTYRVKGQEQTTTRTFGYTEYLKWAADLDRNGYQLVQAQQVPAEA